MKGLFIPGITAEMFRNGCLEGIEALMAEGEIYDIDYEPEQRWISCKERLPEDYENVLVYFEYYRYGDYHCMFSTYGIGSYRSEYDSWLVNGKTGWRKLHVFAWLPLPEPYKEDG